ncbi:MAG: CDP-alcohol phosphatidyltransferase family protein [Verrucomicrobiota bacterium]|nr:CDP-alcohol phosphatidyltransferase family protein [Verrucomicrobiota bacterium]
MSTSWRKFIPCCCTCLALCAGIGSLLATASGEFLHGAQLIILSLLLDGLDGTLARLLKGQSEFGAELDTFVDITSFGIAPAVLLYFYPGGLHDVPFWGFVLTCLYVISGASRLSRFRVADPYRGQRGYLGLPITAAGGWVATWVIALESSGHWSVDWLSIRNGPMAVGFWLSVLLMLWLQVSHVRYGKPTKNPLVLLPFLVILILLYIPPAAVYAAFLLGLYTVWYVFVSPFFFQRFLAHLPPVEEEAVAVPPVDAKQ